MFTLYLLRLLQSDDDAIDIEDIVALVNNYLVPVPFRIICRGGEGLVEGKAGFLYSLLLVEKHLRKRIGSGTNMYLPELYQ